MPANPRSLRATELYRDRLLAIRSRVERDAERRWRDLMPQDLDGDAWIAATAASVAGAQTEAIRATAGYVAAFLSLELGRRVQAPPLDTRLYAGLSRDGRPLEEALQSPLVGTKVALKDGQELSDALDVGLQRARRATAFNVDQAARQALLDTIDADPRFDGWQRAVRGTCGACLAAASGPDGGLRFEVHDGCQCVSEPIVSGASDRFPRPTGPELFAAMPTERQDEILGADTAEAVRTGAVALHELKKRSPMETETDWITQAPLSEVTSQ